MQTIFDPSTFTFTLLKLPTFIFHLITQFSLETTATRITHGLGDSLIWFMGVHGFELCNAQGGVLNIVSFKHGKLNQVGKD